jgi:hypothetical protein
MVLKACSALSNDSPNKRNPDSAHTGRGMPLGFEAGDANLYRYVKNSPTDLIDPTGLTPELVRIPGRNGAPDVVALQATQQDIERREPFVNDLVDRFFDGRATQEDRDNYQRWQQTGTDAERALFELMYQARFQQRNAQHLNGLMEQFRRAEPARQNSGINERPQMVNEHGIPYSALQLGMTPEYAAHIQAGNRALYWTCQIGSMVPGAQGLILIPIAMDLAEGNWAGAAFNSSVGALSLVRFAGAARPVQGAELARLEAALGRTSWGMAAGNPWLGMSPRILRRWLESLDTLAAQGSSARLTPQQIRELIAHLRQQGWTIPRGAEEVWIGGRHINIIGSGGGPNIHLPVPPGFTL